VETTDSVDYNIGADDSITRTDGSIYYSNEIRHRTNDQVKELAIAFGKAITPYSLGKFDSLSNIELFENFVRYLQLNKVDVILFLPPYNPIAYDLLLESNKYKHILIAEKYLINFAKLNDIDIKGSYSPHKYDFANKDFFDGVHGRDQVIKKIFETGTHDDVAIQDIMPGEEIKFRKLDGSEVFGHSNYLSKAAKALTSGKMIAGFETNDDRLFQELIIKNLRVRNDVIAIGSSTTMHLRKEFVSKDRINFFNHSVAGASIEDYIAFVGAYEVIHDYLPSTIILGVDPWVFNKNNGQGGRWTSLKKYYDVVIFKLTNPP